MKLAKAVWRIQPWIWYSWMYVLAWTQWRNFKGHYLWHSEWNQTCDCVLTQCPYLIHPQTYTHTFIMHLLQITSAVVKMGLLPPESLPAGSNYSWLCWRSLNRMRTGVGRAKPTMRKWHYMDEMQSTKCDRPDNAPPPLLRTTLLDGSYTLEDLAPIMDRAKAYVQIWHLGLKETVRRICTSLSTCHCSTVSWKLKLQSYTQLWNVHASNNCYSCVLFFYGSSKNGISHFISKFHCYVCR